MRVHKPARRDRWRSWIRVKEFRGGREKFPEPCRRPSVCSFAWRSNAVPGTQRTKPWVPARGFILCVRPVDAEHYVK